MLTLVLLLLLCTGVIFAGTTDMQLFVNGKSVTTDVSPVIVDNRMLIPARAVFEAAGGTVKWDEATPQYVGISYGENEITLTINSKQANVNGTVKTLDVPAQLVKDRTLIPVRFVAENLGFQVDYNDASREVAITAPALPAPPAAVTPPGITTSAAVSTPPAVSSPPGIATPPGVGPSSDSNLNQITSISFDPTADGCRITVAASAPIQTHQESSLTNPFRFITDIKGFTWDQQDFKLQPDENNRSLVQTVRASQFDADTVRIVTDLSANVKGQISFSPDQKSMYIDFDNDTGHKPKTLSDVLVVVDPGHGGLDPGSQAMSGKTVVLTEKETTLDIATRLNKKLQAAGIHTEMTRTGDTLADPASPNATVDLKARANKVNNFGATLCISIHNNSAPGISSAKGTETLYYDTPGKLEYGFSSKELASRIQKNMIADCGTYDRGIKERPELGMLRMTNMPTVIVEGAFLSNPDDLKKLQSEEFREQYATAVADAVIQYLHDVYPQ